MNYRHAFHAGNFADVVKHACLALLIRELAQGEEALTVVETHAGAGRYDLSATPAERTGEAANGVARLMAAEDAPAAFAPYLAVLRRENPSGEVTTYPGSPAIAARMLRAQDRYAGVELRDDDHAALKTVLRARANAEAVHGDGWKEALNRVRRGERTLVMCDPPFESGEDYDAAARLLSSGLKIENRAVMAVWLPIKDLETFDGFVREVEALNPPPTLVAEVRLRSLDDPMRLNGCALVVVNDPGRLQASMAEVCRWTAERLGEPGGEGRVWRIGAAREATAA